MNRDMLETIDVSHLEPRAFGSLVGMRINIVFLSFPPNIKIVELVKIDLSKCHFPFKFCLFL